MSAAARLLASRGLNAGDVEGFTSNDPLKKQAQVRSLSWHAFDFVNCFALLYPRRSCSRRSPQQEALLRRPTKILSIVRCPLFLFLFLLPGFVSFSVDEDEMMRAIYSFEIDAGKVFLFLFHYCSFSQDNAGSLFPGRGLQEGVLQLGVSSAGRVRLCARSRSSSDSHPAAARLPHKRLSAEGSVQDVRKWCVV